MKIAVSLSITTAFLLLSSLSMVGAEPVSVSDSLALREKLSERESSWDLMRGHYLSQLPLHHLRYSSSLSTFGITYEGRQENEALLREVGTGKHIFQLSASTYLQPSAKEHVWGQAMYANGEKIGLRWNNVSDYEKLYPYILADKVGGNMRHETYAFGGGYSRQVGAIRLAGAVSYRSLQEFRTRDPRPRNIVSDLSTTVALSTALGAYELGWSVGGEVYKQRSSITFYSPLGTETQYLLNGLGSNFARFSSNDPAVYYRGFAGSASMHIAPRTLGKGFIGQLGYRYSTLEQILTDLNEVPIHHYDAHGAQLSLGYIFEPTSSPLVYMLDLRSELETKIGIEHVVGEPKAGTYPIEGYLRNLIAFRSKNQLALHLSNAQSQSVQCQWYVEPSVGFQIYDVRKLAPSRVLRTEQWSGALMGQLTYFLPKEQTVTLRLGGSYAPKAKGELSLPYALMRQEHIEHQLYTFASLSSAYYELSIAPRYSFAVQRGALPWGLEVGCQYRYRGYMPQDRLPVHQHEWRATVQLIF